MKIPVCLWMEGGDVKRIWDIGKRKACESQGMTLVEVIVAFGLTGMFLACAVIMLSSGLKMYARVQSISDAVLVSQQLLDRIAGEISAADRPAEGAAGDHVWLEDGERDYDDINRHFDKDMYLGYHIENLSFSREEPETFPEVVRIDLTIRNDLTGFEYSTWTVVMVLLA